MATIIMLLQQVTVVLIQDGFLGVILFMEKMGKLLARAQSLRKITSKLAAHLQPGNLARVRVIEKGNLVQVVDALKIGKVSADLDKLRLLGNLLADNQPEDKLWQEYVT